MHQLGVLTEVYCKYITKKCPRKKSVRKSAENWC